MCVLEPADIQAPRLMRVFDDGKVLLRLRPGRHLPITKYFVIVVPDVLSRLRNPSDFRLDEVSAIRLVLSHKTALSAVHYVVAIWNCLPPDIRTVDSHRSLRRSRKTHFCREGLNITPCINAFIYRLISFPSSLYCMVVLLACRQDTVHCNNGQVCWTLITE